MTEYRKVKPEDEIPTRMLTPQSQKSRIARANKEPSRKGQKLYARAILGIIQDENFSTQRMYDFYENIDKFSDEVVKPLSVCAKGCAQCCHVPVQVSYIEALFISEEAGIPIDFKRARGGIGTACPFLDSDNLCKVREHRPLACRLFHTIDHWQYCVDDVRHLTIGLNGYEGLLDIHELFCSQQSPYGYGYADIREWFAVNEK